MTQWLIGIFVRLIKLQRRPNQLCGGGKTNSSKLVGVLSHSLFIILFWPVWQCHQDLQR